MRIETKAEIGVFFKHLQEYLQKNDTFRNHNINISDFDESNQRVWGLIISIFPKGIHDELFFQTNGSNLFVYNLQFWKEWHKTERIIIFALWSGENAEKSGEFKKLKTKWPYTATETKSGFTYNVENEGNYVDLSKRNIPNDLKSMPNDVDETKIFPIIEKTLEKIYNDYNDKFETLFNIGTTKPIDKYQQIIKEYIDYCKSDEIWDEAYKWKAVSHFQNSWNINASDFGAMFKEAVKKRANLIHQYPISTLIDGATLFPDIVKGILKYIFNEDLEIIQRFNYFKSETKKLAEKLQEQRNLKNLPTPPREAEFAFLLTCNNPEKHYFYNSRFYEKFANCIEQEPKNAGEKYKHYIEIMNYFRDNYVINNQELIEITKQKLPENEQFKNNISLITQSIIFLVFEVIRNNADEKTLISALTEVGYENSNNLYNLSDKLISELKIVIGDERVHYNCNPKENFNLTIGQRYCIEYGIKHKTFGVIVPKQIAVVPEMIGFEFDGQPDANFIRTPNINEIYEYEKDFVTASENELRRTTKSGFRKFTNPAFEKSIFDIDYRNELFLEIFDQLFVSNTTSIKMNKKTNIPLNQILYGPPGTGKTYHTINKAIEIIDNSFYQQNKDNRNELKKRFKELKEIGQIVFTTFHQSMSYEEFLESLKPFESNGNVLYRIDKGIFTLICKEAEEFPNENFVLIIDEINRGNIASIFGELITLIEPDKRKGADEELSVKLPYSKIEFTVPKNLYIIGTMNTADRSVEALDSALRRRFVFSEIAPNEKLLNNNFNGVNLQNILEKINLRIEKLIDKDHKIGHSYLMNLENIESLQNAFKNKLLPLLEEYFYGDFAKIGLILGNDFVTQSDTNENVFKKIDTEDDYSDFENKIVYNIDIPEYQADFIKAIKNIYL